MKIKFEKTYDEELINKILSDSFGKDTVVSDFENRHFFVIVDLIYIVGCFEIVGYVRLQNFGIMKQHQKQGIGYQVIKKLLKFDNLKINTSTPEGAKLYIKFKHNFKGSVLTITGEYLTTRLRNWFNSLLL
jgi:hypothetical protein